MLFHARVLLAEADVASAKRTKEMLDNAGYMVKVEGDGKQVRKRCNSFLFERG